MPEPKSRNSATSNASTLTTALLILPSGSDATHVEFSAQLDKAGQEKRASMHRTALVRGEQAYTKPAPTAVALLIQVCEWAQKIPLPQFSFAGAIVGRALALTKRSAQAKKVSSFIVFMCRGVYMIHVYYIYMCITKYNVKYNKILIKF
jgi:hypothetical protein